MKTSIPVPWVIDGVIHNGDDVPPASRVSTAPEVVCVLLRYACCCCEVPVVATLHPRGVGWRDRVQFGTVPRFFVAPKAPEMAVKMSFFREQVPADACCHLDVIDTFAEFSTAGCRAHDVLFEATLEVERGWHIYRQAAVYNEKGEARWICRT